MVTFTNVGHLYDTQFCIYAELSLNKVLVATKTYDYHVTADKEGSITIDEVVQGNEISVSHGGIEGGRDVRFYFMVAVILSS